jgi:signal transduction histidine kinase
LIAVVSYFSASPRRFTPRELEFTETVAGLFAVAFENAQLHQDLQQREQLINQLLETTIDAQEDERQRICLEVHDGVAQSLAPAFHYLQAVEVSTILPATLRSQVHRAGELVQEAMRETREIIASLRPASLDTIGLVATLRNQLQNLAEEHHLAVEFSATDRRYNSTIETGLYRIAHEAITNAIKHAQATSLSVQLRVINEILILSVQDNGIGLGVDGDLPGTERKGIGLFSMRKRAELLMGSFAVTSVPGAGTLIRVEVPLGHAD